MPIYDHPRYGEAKPSARAVFAASAGCVLLKNATQVFKRYGPSRVTDIDTVGIGLSAGPVPALCSRRNRRTAEAALPEVRVTAQFDGSCLGCEPAGIVENVDQHLLQLSRFEVEGFAGRQEIYSYGDGLVVEEWRNLMQRLLKT